MSRWYAHGTWQPGLMVDTDEDTMLRARLLWRLADILTHLGDHAATKYVDRHDRDWGGRRWFT